MERSDRELMVAYQQGDADAFAILYDRYQRQVISFFYRKSYDRTLAEDLCQEAFLRIVKSRHRYRPEATFRTFLFTVARNLFIDHIRSKKAAPKMVSADKRVGEDGATVGDLVETGERGTVEALSDREGASRVVEAMKTLPEALRDVAELVAPPTSLKYREAAEILGIPVGTVKSRMNAALTSLRGQLGRMLS